MIALRHQGIRWRLALLYSGIFGAGLIVFCALLFKYYQRTQVQAFDQTLFNYAVDTSSGLEMDFVGRVFPVGQAPADSGKWFPFPLGNHYMEIRDIRGSILVHQRSLGEKTLPLDQRTLAIVQQEKAVTQTISTAELGVKSTTKNLRLITYWAHHADWREPLILQIAVPMDLLEKEQFDLLLFFAIAIPLFLITACLGGVWMSKPALRPVRDITEKAKSITGVEKLKERIPVPAAQDEIHELAVTFNSLLDRLDKAFASQDRFISNASHQLKTPLTILKGELELLQKSGIESVSVREGLESARGEINRLIQLVQDLLLLARLEAGRDTIALTPVHVDEALIQVVARLQKLASNKNVQLTTHLSAATAGAELEAEVLGDEDLLGSMFENFIENAVKYSPADSTVEIEMRTLPDAVEVRIRDNGPGIPAELRQKIFERFTRVQPSNVIPGSGLGLSIASEIAHIHNAKIELTAPQYGPGTIVTIRFGRR
jgi:signal transduction histidine kinase